MGISFHAVIVFGLGKNLLFIPVLGHCDNAGYSQADHTRAGHSQRGHAHTGHTYLGRSRLCRLVALKNLLNVHFCNGNFDQMLILALILILGKNNHNGKSMKNYFQMFS